MLVDAENTVNESLISNNLGESAPIVVRLPGTNGTSVVPTTAAAGVLPSLKAQPAPKTKPHPKLTGPSEAGAPRKPPKKLHRKPPRRNPAIVQRHHRAANQGEQPHQEVRLRRPAERRPALTGMTSAGRLDWSRHDRRDAESREPSATVSTCNPHNPSIFRQFGGLSVPIARNLRQN